ncbi:hypothetical protein GCM10023405_21260 [Streptomonospora salina]
MQAYRRDPDRCAVGEGQRPLRKNDRQVHDGGQQQRRAGSVTCSLPHGRSCVQKQRSLAEPAQQRGLHSEVEEEERRIDLLEYLASHPYAHHGDEHESSIAGSAVSEVRGHGRSQGKGSRPQQTRWNRKAVGHFTLPRSGYRPDTP